MQSQMQDDKRKSQQDHEEQITALQNELVDKNAQIMQQGTVITSLRQEIADFAKIGVAEPQPPKRQQPQRELEP